MVICSRAPVTGASLCTRRDVPRKYATRMQGGMEQGAGDCTALCWSAGVQHTSQHCRTAEIGCYASIFRWVAATALGQPGEPRAVDG